MYKNYQFFPHKSSFTSSIIYALSILVIITAITIIPVQSSASEYTKKWAAQRQAAQERERQRKEKNRLNKETMELFFGTSSGGANLNNDPVKKLPQRNKGNVEYGNTGGSNEDWDCSQGLLGTAGNCIKKSSQNPDRWVAGPWVGKGPCKSRKIVKGKRSKREYFVENGLRKCVNYWEATIDKECNYRSSGYCRENVRFRLRGHGPSYSETGAYSFKDQ